MYTGTWSSIVHSGDPESGLGIHILKFLRKFVTRILSRLDKINIHFHVEGKAMVDQRVKTRVFRDQNVWIYCEGFLSG